MSLRSLAFFLSLPRPVFLREASGGLPEPSCSDFEGVLCHFSAWIDCFIQVIARNLPRFQANLRHVAYLWHHHSYAGAPACLDSHGRPRSKPSDLKGSSGSLRDGRRCGPSALAASVCDGSRWPRAMLRHRFLPRDLSESFRGRRSRAVRTDGVGPSSSGGRRSARRRSPSPNPAHGAAALRTQPRIKPHAAPRRPAHPRPPARRSQR